MSESAQQIEEGRSNQFLLRCHTKSAYYFRYRISLNNVLLLTLFFVHLFCTPYVGPYFFQGHKPIHVFKKGIRYLFKITSQRRILSTRFKKLIYDNYFRLKNEKLGLAGIRRPQNHFFCEQIIRMGHFGGKTSDWQKQTYDINSEGSTKSNILPFISRYSIDQCDLKSRDMRE